MKRVDAYKDSEGRIFRDVFDCIVSEYEIYCKTARRKMEAMLVDPNKTKWFDEIHMNVVEAFDIGIDEYDRRQVEFNKLRKDYFYITGQKELGKACKVSSLLSDIK